MERPTIIHIHHNNHVYMCRVSWTLACNSIKVLFYAVLKISVVTWSKRHRGTDYLSLLLLN